MIVVATWSVYLFCYSRNVST